MSGQALQAELTSLAQEAKRKNPEIRTAAEKSLQDLKSLPSTSEQQLAADLSRRPTFIDPFLLACNTQNAKYAGSATVCLQRLVIIRGLPKSRLKDVLNAFNACTSLGLDIQLKVLQALPALAQNYADDLKGDHLAAALQVCAALQNVKAATVSGVAAATLQQLVVSVFDRVAAEDEAGDKFPIVTRISGGDGPIPLKEAAYDAYRVFLDIYFATEGQNTRFVRFSGLSAASGLELMGTCLGSHPKIFASHPEQTNIIRTVVMPHLIRIISERQTFGVTLRALRVASFIIRRHLQAMPDECEVVLGLLTHMIDSEATAWKRAMCMEVFRLVYTEPGLAVQIYLQYDSKDGKKSIVRDNIASFVKISTEKPSVIGLGQHSSAPTDQARDTIAEQVAMEAAGGVAGVIAPSSNVADANVSGISTRWSVPKTQCMDQLDKTDPPALPETYIYSLVLECLNGLSENLAKVVLPLTVQQHTNDQEQESDGEVEDGEHVASPQKTGNRRKRSQSYRSRTVPLNPLSTDESAQAIRIRAIAKLVEQCWPALLATYSTFLNASLDNDYYRALIRSYQRFVQVSGLLRLSTSRDAFLTTLGKAAVPPSIVTSSISSVSSPTAEAPGIYSNSKGLLSVESFSTQTSGNDRSRRTSYDPASKPTLSTRNLLCLRALLNVAIAIGPTMESSFNIVFETLLQAGVVLNASQAKSTSIGPEIAAVEGAVFRLLESTADYPNDAFLHVLTTLCRLLSGRTEAASSSSTQTKPSSAARRISSLPGITTDIALSTQDYMFVLTRINDLAEHNISRFATYSSLESGWTVLVDRLVDLSITMSIPDDARRLAADILAWCSVAVAEASTSDEPEDAALAQKMVLSSLHLLIRQVYEQGSDLGNVDIDIHNRVLDSVRAVLEKSGEALTAGWETILAIIGSVFDTNDAEEQQQHDEQNRKEGWLKLSSQFVAPYLGRSAFGVMQLVCSDFLAPLPQTCLSPLVEILFHFASQTSDLNISLTAITLFWDVSDFLVKQQVVSGLNELTSGITEERLVLGHERIVTRSKESRPAQWVLLMYRLTDVIADERLEVRNSAFQTLLRIFKNHSVDFSNPAWQLAIETLLFKVLRENVEKQRTLRSSKVSSDVIIGLDSTSSEIIGDITSLLIGQFEQMASLDAFDQLWSDLMEIFEALLSFHSSVINAAVYESLSTLLGAFGSNNHKLRQAVSRTEFLWSSAVPDCSADVKGQTAEQDQYIAYVNCGRSIYGLIEKNASTDQLDKLVQNMIDCVKSSSGAAYSSDVNSLTMLQQKVLEHLRALHGNIELVSSTLVNAASQLVSSPFTSHEKPKTNLTFVALSKASMDWLVDLIAKDLSRPEMFQSGAVAKALEDLAIPMGLKYRWAQPGRAPALWQKASSASLSIIGKTLAQMRELNIENEMKTRIWTAIVNIAHAVMHADIDEASPQPTFETVEKDEVFDCEIMRQLKAMITPTLGSADIPDATRQTYVSSLFNASLIHSVERGDIPQDVSLLDNPYALRMGRVRDPEPSLREDMAYLCFTELVSLVGNPSGNQVKLSQAATSCLVLRFALPLKAYIVDQPLRGSLPQPLSQVEELLFCLTEVEKLQGLSDTMDKVDGAGKTEYQAHLQLLFPLVVKAVGVAGDKRYGNKKVLNLLERVLVAIR